MYLDIVYTPFVLKKSFWIKFRSNIANINYE
jgi:hypothetical protein